jgi:hypothetical protein
MEAISKEVFSPLIWMTAASRPGMLEGIPFLQDRRGRDVSGRSGGPEGTCLEGIPFLRDAGGTGDPEEVEVHVNSRAVIS